MIQTKRKKMLLCVAVAYWVLVSMIFLIAHETFDHVAAESESLSASMTTTELTDGQELLQAIVAPADVVTEISLKCVPYAPEGSVLLVELFDEAGELVGTASQEISQITAHNYYNFHLDAPVFGYLDRVLTLRLTTSGCVPGQGIILYFGDGVTTGRFDVFREITDGERFSLNGTPGQGKLCLKLVGIRMVKLQRVYWLIAGGLFLAAALLVWHGLRRQSRGKRSAVIQVCDALITYKFLMKQLVGRDFKAKYKRSVLGILWSFLNPLLTMAVQYFVFSTLFKSDTPYYSVYLLTGLILYNFFSEACAMGLSSITGNAALIKKVYMPKLIYPVTKVMSSSINFLISLVPLLGIMLLSGLKLTPALVLLVYDFLCMLMFIMGMVLILSTMMTFFQDTQFLWSVVSMMWLYLTPIIYPESIIPAKYLTLYHMNPMYQYIAFARVCIINGASPAPTAYLWCLLSGAVFLLTGILIFRKNQDQFVLHL